MKKILSLILAFSLIFCVFFLFGCNNRKVEYIAVDETSEYKTLYDTGDPLDLTGLKIKLYDKDDLVIKTVDVTEDMVEDYVVYKYGVQSLTITYAGRTTEFTIVNSPVPAKLVVASVNHKVVYNVGEELDVTGLQVQLQNKNGHIVEAAQDVTEGMVSGFDSSKPGDCYATITYYGLSVQIYFKIV